MPVQAAFLQSLVRPQKFGDKDMATGFADNTARGFLLKMLALQFKGEMIDKLALPQSAKSEMQKMWFNLLFHHSPGCM